MDQNADPLEVIKALIKQPCKTQGEGSMTEEWYIEKEGARLALARMLDIPYTVDLTKQPEADLLKCGPFALQVILAKIAGSEVTFDPYRRQGDAAVFIQRIDDATYIFLGSLLNTDIDDVTEFWREGAVPLARLRDLKASVLSAGGKTD